MNQKYNPLKAPPFCHRFFRQFSRLSALSRKINTELLLDIMKDFVGDLLLKWVITKTITEHASVSNAQKKQF